MWRTGLGVIREPLIIRVRMMQTIFIILLLGLIYLNQQLTVEGASNINGRFFSFSQTW